MLVLCVCISIAVIDQAAKLLIQSKVYLGQEIAVVPGFFHISHVRNTGAAWGILQDQNILLTSLSLAVLLLLCLCRRTFLRDTFAHRIALGLMLGGIVGNLLDRVRLGYVVDFLHFFLRSSHFPSFNVADAAICIGVAIYVVSEIRTRPPLEDAAADSATIAADTEGDPSP